MTAATLPPEWPVCGAPNREAVSRSRIGRQPRRGDVCQAAGDGYEGRCRYHGGLALPEDHDWALLYTATGIYVVPWLEDEGAQASHGVRISWRIAAALVEAGKVRRGAFFRHMGQSLLRRWQTTGVTAKVVSSHRCVREYAFEVEGALAPHPPRLRCPCEACIQHLEDETERGLNRFGETLAAFEFAPEVEA